MLNNKDNKTLQDYCTLTQFGRLYCNPDSPDKTATRRLIIERTEIKSTHIIIPEVYGKKQQEGQIVAVDERIENLSVGDVIVFANYVGVPIIDEETRKEYIILDEDFVYCKVIKQEGKTSILPQPKKVLVKLISREETYTGKLITFTKKDERTDCVDGIVTSIGSSVSDAIQIDMHVVLSGGQGVYTDNLLAFEGDKYVICDEGDVVGKWVDGVLSPMAKQHIATPPKEETRPSKIIMPNGARKNIQLHRAICISSPEFETGDDVLFEKAYHYFHFDKDKLSYVLNIFIHDDDLYGGGFKQC